MIATSSQPTESPSRFKIRCGAVKGALLCAMALAAPSGGPVASKEAVIWIESYEEALAEARLTGKPIFLEFRCAP